MPYEVAWWEAPGQDSEAVYAVCDDLQEAIDSLPSVPRPNGLPCVRVSRHVRLLDECGPLGALQGAMEPEEIEVARTDNSDDAWVWHGYWIIDKPEDAERWKNMRTVLRSELAETALRMAEIVERKLLMELAHG